jgi:hypothetical protein
MTTDNFHGIDRLVGHARASFPQPWCADEQEACFIVRDANGQALAYVYSEEEPGRRVRRGALRPRSRAHTPCGAGSWTIK